MGMGDITDADIDFFDPAIEKLRPRVALRTPLGGGAQREGFQRSSSTMRSMRATSVAPSSWKHLDAEDDLDFGADENFGLRRARRAVSEARDLIEPVGRGYEQSYSRSGGYGGNSYNRTVLTSRYSGIIQRDPQLDILAPLYRARRTQAGQNFYARPMFTDFLNNQRSSSVNYKSRGGSAFENDDFFGKSIFDSSDSKLSKFRKSASTFNYDDNFGKFNFDAESNLNTKYNALRKKYGQRTSALENYVHSAVDDSANNEVIGETTLGARFDRYAERLAKDYFQRYYGGEKKFFEKQATGKRNAKFAHYWI